VGVVEEMKTIMGEWRREGVITRDSKRRGNNMMHADEFIDGYDLHTRRRQGLLRSRGIKGTSIPRAKSARFGPVWAMTPKVVQR